MKKIFARKRSSLSNSFSLPSDFSEQVLELEILISQTPSKYAVLKLMKLYSTAVEYYETQKDSKYIYFHGKLQELMTNPNVMPLLDNKPSTPLLFKKNAIKKRQNSMQLMRKSESLLEDHNNISYCSGQKLVQNLKGQEESLASRIKDRHKRYSNFGHKSCTIVAFNNRNTSEDQNLSELNKEYQHLYTKKEHKSGRDKNEFFEHVKEIEKYKISEDTLKKRIKDLNNPFNNNRANRCVKVIRENNQSTQTPKINCFKTNLVHN